MARYTKPDAGDPIINSRDVYLAVQDMDSDWESAKEDARTAFTEAAEKSPDDRSADEQKLVERYQTADEAVSDTNFVGDFFLHDYDDYISLRKFNDEGEGTGDWMYGATLINEDHFTQYAEELAEELGLLQKSNAWPLNHIDWEAAANELKQDYTEIDFGGETYFVHS